jgi:hypothetical protein
VNSSICFSTRGGHAAALAVLLALATGAAWAATGDLVQAYGHGGLASVAAPVGANPEYALRLGEDPGPAIAIAPDGAVLIARHESGRCFLERLGADGLNGLVALGAPVACVDRLRPEVNVGPAGEILFAYAPDAATVAIELRRADGTPDPNFGGGSGRAGSVVLNIAGGLGGRGILQRLDDGDVVLLANSATTSAQSPYVRLFVIRLDADGRPDTWGSSGVVEFPAWELGPLVTDAGGVVTTSSTSVVLLTSNRAGNALQTLSRAGSYYPYFQPERSVDGTSIYSEFDGAWIAALQASNRMTWSYDAPSMQSGGLPFWAGQPALHLTPPDEVVSGAASFDVQRFSALDGAPLVLGRQQAISGGLGQVGPMLLKFLPSGVLDASFGTDGKAALDLPLGDASAAIRAPFALAQDVAQPRVIGGDRIVVAGWASNRLAVAVVQLRATGASAGALGFLARGGQFVLPVDAGSTANANAELRFQVARRGGRSGAVAVSYRTVAPATLTGAYVPASGRLEWADGEQATREISLRLSIAPGTLPEGAIDIVLESPAGGAVLGSAAQRVLLADLGGGAVSFRLDSTTVAASAGRASVDVVRTGGTRGAIAATVRVPIAGDAGGIAVNFADGEAGPKTVQVPFESTWSHFDATLEAGSRATLGAITKMHVEVTQAPATAPPTTPSTPSTPSSGVASGGGGGSLSALDLLALCAMLGIGRLGSAVTGYSRAHRARRGPAPRTRIPR